MNDELRSKLSEDLRRSGFYSELRAVQMCVSRNWECHGSPTYYDKDEKTTRECDFEALNGVAGVRKQKGLITMLVRLLGQVKKAERPWIVFKDRTFRPLDTIEAWDNIIYELNLPLERSQLADTLSQDSLIGTNGWKASGVHEAFKKPNDASTWYTAFVSACKAAESANDAAVAAYQPFLDGDEVFFELIKPIVVFDGTLVAAEVDDKGDLELTEIESAAFRFEYRSESYQRHHYCLDLVTLRGLSGYLDLTVRRMKRVFDTLVERDAAEEGKP
jgi:hypothetical protein